VISAQCSVVGGQFAKNGERKQFKPLFYLIFLKSLGINLDFTPETGLRAKKQGKTYRNGKGFRCIVTQYNTPLWSFANLLELLFFIVFSFSGKFRLIKSQTATGPRTLIAIL